MIKRLCDFCGNPADGQAKPSVTVERHVMDPAMGKASIAVAVAYIYTRNYVGPPDICRGCQVALLDELRERLASQIGKST